MVLPLLLSDPSTGLRYGDLGRTVLHFLHVVHSMERATSIFLEAVSYESRLDESDTPPTSSLSSFDAHVGDCACQTRAQMFWDLFSFYKKEENRSVLANAVAVLKSVKANTAKLLEEIELNRAKPRCPSLMTLVTHQAVWERIGFLSFLDLSHKDTEERGKPFQDDPESQCMFSFHFSYIYLSQICLAGSKKVSQSGHRHRDIVVDTEWMPSDIVFVSRLLTMCNMLSEFRFASIEAGPPARVKVRVDLPLMYERNAKELEYLNLSNKRRIDYHIQAHSKTNRQTEAMQIYVSRVTVDWVKKAAMKRNGSWTCFPDSFFATSNRKIECVAAYASFLIVREAWLKSRIPILMMIQHFCSHGGYRNLYCRILPNPADNMTTADYVALGQAQWFDIEVLTVDQIASAPWNRNPHTIIVGMSCQGTIEDFRLRLLESQQGLLPVQHRCRQADECALAIECINISHLVAHFFSQHEQFPFTLPGGEDEIERVGCALEHSLGAHAKSAFFMGRAGAEKFGTGRSTRLATIEHIFLEYPSVFANDMKRIGEKPQVLGCQLE
ncbi:putative cyclodipeptide synthase PUL1 [Psilocybe cubensis]|uniref:Cyclodipeptide synthase PUL1 n=2 Tax=Psilocybe cubensis TaxID=181762 RepID=A0ACB8H8D3_PSICU|nr:putative cyclodipeptide synthase PUL1 [Psilocybe cubensis]KAH9483425.1 putative cyclodipeptide synthase PUL1 [Psilocybe cubensis]